MTRRILIVPDKFKGSLSALEAAGAIARGWAAACPDDTLALLPMSDGGDGFGPVMAGALGLEEQLVEVVDAACQARPAAWWFDSEFGQAVVETAQSNGLALLPRGRFHPFDLDTRRSGATAACRWASGGGALPHGHRGQRDKRRRIRNGAGARLGVPRRVGQTD